MGRWKKKISQRSKWSLIENSERRLWSWERRNRLKMKQMEMMESLTSSMLSLSSGTCVEWRLSGMPTRLEALSTGARWAASALYAVKRTREDSKDSISSRNGQRLRKLVSQTTSNGRTLDTVLSTEDQCHVLSGLLLFSWLSVPCWVSCSSKFKPPSLSRSLRVTLFALQIVLISKLRLSKIIFSHRRIELVWWVAIAKHKQLKTPRVSLRWPSKNLPLKLIQRKTTGTAEHGLSTLPSKMVW